MPSVQETGGVGRRAVCGMDRWSVTASDDLRSLSQQGPVIELNEIVAHNRWFVRQNGRLRVYVAAQATVIVGAGDGNWFKLCQMGFSKDGSFHLTWPYLSSSQGIVAEVELPPDAPDGTPIALTERGRFTSQRVKYSHHRSGIAQFSLSGRVRNEVRRQSFPLNGPIGHIFGLQCHNPAGFSPLDRLKAGRLYVTLVAQGGVPNGISLRGTWHRKELVRANLRGRSDQGPVATFLHQPSGESGRMTFWSPPLDSPLRNHLLGLFEGQPITSLATDEPGIVLLGGFDPHEIPPNVEAKLLRKGLAALYPARGSVELRRRVGTIDLEPGSLG